MKLLNDYLEHTCMTQAELARRLGIDDATLSSLLSGRRKAGPATILRIHKAIGFPVAKIIESCAQEYGE